MTTERKITLSDDVTNVEIITKQELFDFVVVNKNTKILPEYIEKWFEYFKD